MEEIPMLNSIEIFLPLALIVLIALPLVNVFRGKATAKSAKRRLLTHIFSFFAVIVASIIFSLSDVSVFAAEEAVVAAGITGTIAQGLGFISAALATGMSALGAGIAVAAAAPAAIGAFSENEKNFGKSLIFVALGEGVAIYGLLISILIINKL
jgi:V/A-type H+-transporting ATPase subunit K